jgi:hypothetical protein
VKKERIDDEYGDDSYRDSMAECKVSLFALWHWLFMVCAVGVAIFTLSL